MNTPYQEILDFWFGQITDLNAFPNEKAKMWFGRSDEIDLAIKNNFQNLVEQAIEGNCNTWIASPPGRLAVIILLDQFTRNIYRNQPNAFSGDPQAKHLCLEGLKKDQDGQLSPVQRVFFYLPLEHSEIKEDQEFSVQKYRELIDSTNGELKEKMRTFYDYAVKHKEIIDQFGRFPHRNKILGRTSTAEEIKFLTQPGSSF